nr:efflux RND transporter permease subunit [Steroidobacter cummioxidans]
MLRSLIAQVVHRRLVALAITAAVAIYGLFAYFDTAIEAYPDVTNVQVGVITQAPGLPPEEIERQITLPLERALNGTPGLQSLRSESYFGLSLVAAVFDDDTRSDFARVQVMQRLMQAELPDGVTAEMAPDSTPLGKIYYYRLVSDRHDLSQLRIQQETTVTRVLKQVQGVADVVGIGGFLKEIHVEVDPARLIGLELTLSDVIDAIAASNGNVGGGLLRRGEQSLIVRGIGLLRTPQDIMAVVLKADGGVPVTVGDVARVIQSYTPRQGAVGMDDHDDIVQGIVLLKRDANPSRVLDEVHRRVEQLNESILPKGMRMEPSYDRSELIGHTLATVFHNLLFGGALIVGVLWLFLRSVRGSLIVASVIPMALLVAFIGLHMLGMPANLISMGAIDFGIIVDGAVVLAESILATARVRRPATRSELYDLIIDSAVAVARPTLFAMAIIIAALIPIFSLESVEGRIFRPLALTYSFALVGALVFAMLLVPALCAIGLRPKDADTREPEIFERMQHWYERCLQRVIESARQRRLACGVAVLALLLAAFAASRLGTEFLPELDEGDVYVLVQMPSSISLEKGQEVLRDVRRRLRAFPETRAVVSEQGRPESGTDNEWINLAKVLVRLQPHDQWRAGVNKEALVAQMRAALIEIPGVAFNFAQPIRDSVEESTSGARGHVVLKLFGPDIDTLRALLQKTRALLEPVDGIVDLDLYRDSPAPQLQVEFNRQALARYGITMAQAQTTLEAAVGGTVATQFWEGEFGVPVRVRLPYEERTDEARIRDIAVPTASGMTVPLHAISDINIRIGNASIFREGNARYMALKFNVQGRDIGSVVRESIDAFTSNVQLPDGYVAAWGGEWENQRRAATRLTVVIPLSLLIVFRAVCCLLPWARRAAPV